MNVASTPRPAGAHVSGSISMAKLVGRTPGARHRHARNGQLIHRALKAVDETSSLHSQSMRRLLIYLWAFPTTAIGLLFVPLAWIGRDGGMAIVDGVLEVHGGLVRSFLRRCTALPGGACAMTLGHVVLGQNIELLDATRAHERIHVRQVERWGPLFLPAYGLASLVAWYRGGSAYRDNIFEREAYDACLPRAPVFPAKPTDGTVSTPGQ